MLAQVTGLFFAVGHDSLWTRLDTRLHVPSNWGSIFIRNTVSGDGGENVGTFRLHTGAERAHHTHTKDTHILHSEHLC